jgi:hypothetical protein
MQGRKATQFFIQKFAIAYSRFPEAGRDRDREDTPI